MKKIIFTLLIFIYSTFIYAQNNPVVEQSNNNSKINPVNIDNDSQNAFMNVFVATKNELIVIQLKNLNTDDLNVSLSDADNHIIKEVLLYKGSTITSFDTQTLYNGDYVITISDKNTSINKKITLLR